MKCFSLFLALVACASAQEFRGTLNGRVTDPSGSGVPNAKLVVVKTDTNTRSQTVSGVDGNYTLPFLAPGPYEVSTEVSGFKKFVRSGIEIGTNERVTIDIPLQVGNATESVTV